MNFCVAYHSGDKEQVQRWLSWIEELGGLGEHKLFLMPCKGQAADFQTSIPFEVIEDAQGIVSDWSESSDSQIRDASGANSMIRQAAWFFYLKKLGPWMFIEPDCIPTRAGWADEIEAEYQRGGKPFMAAFVPGIPDAFPDHATGNMVLPERAPEVSRLLMLPTSVTVEGDPTQRKVELAFDVAAAPEIIPRCHFTNLIQHVFRGDKFTRMDHLARLNPAACLFHTDKDGGLPNLLRQKMKGGDAQCPSSSISPTAHAVSASEGSNAAATSNPAPPRVHTFFRPCVDQAAFEEQKRILAIWEKNWRDHGWEPVILTEVHARKHPEYDRIKAAFEKMPTVNPKEYELAAFTRWLAMSLHGGLLTDYDTLNNGWEFSNGVLGEYPTILSDNNPVPCAVVGTKEQYQAAVNAFINSDWTTTEGGQIHVSDMLLVQHLRFPAMDTCREFGTLGWQKAKLIHFSHAQCGTARSKRMQEFIDKVEPIFAMAEETRPTNGVLTIMDQIRERLVWIKENSKGITRHHVHRELKALGLLPKK